MVYRLINRVKYNVVDLDVEGNQYSPKEVSAKPFPSEMVSKELSAKVTVRKELAKQIDNEVLAEYVESQLVQEIAKQLKTRLRVEQEVDDFGDLIYKVNYSVVDYNLLEEINERLERNE